MKNLATFKISGNRYIEMLSENEDDNTIFYFDEIDILYNKNGEVFVLFKDFACEGIKVFHNVLQKINNNELQLNPSLQSKSIGYSWNIYCDTLDEDTNNEDIKNMPSLWCTTDEFANITWMYNMGDKIYMEISPIYKWHSVEPNENDDFVEFSKFLSNYKAHDIICIERDVAKQWLVSCKKLLSKMVVG